MIGNIREWVASIRVDGAETLRQTWAYSERLNQSMDRGKHSIGEYDRNMKGAAKATSNTTKEFSKMAQGLGGLVHVYAFMAANIFAATSAFNALREVAKTTQLQESMMALTKVTGIAADSITKDLKRISEGALNAQQAMTVTASASAAGFSGAKIKEIVQVATDASKVLGRDTGDSIDRLVRGLTKLEPELIDEIGLMTRVDEAARDYARSIGKSALELTAFEKRMAFSNAVLEEGRAKFGLLGKEVQANPYDKLAASIDDLWKKMASGPASGIGEFIFSLSDHLPTIIALVTSLGVTIFSKLVKPIVVAKEEMKKFATERVQLEMAAKETFLSRSRLQYQEGRNYKDAVRKNIKPRISARDEALENAMGLGSNTAGLSKAMYNAAFGESASLKNVEIAKKVAIKTNERLIKTLDAEILALQQRSDLTTAEQAKLPKLIAQRDKVLEQHELTVKALDKQVDLMQAQDKLNSRMNSKIGSRWEAQMFDKRIAVEKKRESKRGLIAALAETQDLLGTSAAFSGIKEIWKGNLTKDLGLGKIEDLSLRMEATYTFARGMADKAISFVRSIAGSITIVGGMLLAAWETYQAANRAMGLNLESFRELKKSAEALRKEYETLNKAVEYNSTLFAQGYAIEGFKQRANTIASFVEGLTKTTLEAERALGEQLSAPKQPIDGLGDYALKNAQFFISNFGIALERILQGTGFFTGGVLRQVELRSAEQAQQIGQIWADNFNLAVSETENVVSDRLFKEGVANLKRELPAQFKGLVDDLGRVDTSKLKGMTGEEIANFYKALIRSLPILTKMTQSSMELADAFANIAAQAKELDESILEAANSISRSTAFGKVYDALFSQQQSLAKALSNSALDISDYKNSIEALKAVTQGFNKSGFLGLVLPPEAKATMDLVVQAMDAAKKAEKEAKDPRQGEKDALAAFKNVIGDQDINKLMLAYYDGLDSAVKKTEELITTEIRLNNVIAQNSIELEKLSRLRDIGLSNQITGAGINASSLRAEAGIIDNQIGMITALGKGAEKQYELQRKTVDLARRNLPPQFSSEQLNTEARALRLPETEETRQAIQAEKDAAFWRLKGKTQEEILQHQIEFAGLEANAMVYAQQRAAYELQVAQLTLQRNLALEKAASLDREKLSLAEAGVDTEDEMLERLSKSVYKEETLIQILAKGTELRKQAADIQAEQLSNTVALVEAQEKLNLALYGNYQSNKLTLAQFKQQLDLTRQSQTIRSDATKQAGRETFEQQLAKLGIDKDSFKNITESTDLEKFVRDSGKFRIPGTDKVDATVVQALQEAQNNFRQIVIGEKFKQDLLIIQQYEQVYTKALEVVKYQNKFASSFPNLMDGAKQVWWQIGQTFREDIEKSAGFVESIANIFTSTVDTAVDSFVDALVKDEGNIVEQMREALRSSLQQSIGDAAKDQLKQGLKNIVVGLTGEKNPIAEALTGEAEKQYNAVMTTNDLLRQIDSTLRQAIGLSPSPTGVPESPEAKEAEKQTTFLEHGTKVWGEMKTAIKEGTMEAKVGNTTLGNIMMSGFGAIATSILAGGDSKKAIAGTVLGMAGSILGSYWGAAGSAAGGQIGAMIGSKFANGGVMTAYGPLNLYSKGGVASGPQLAMYGEGRTPEAYVPLPDGRTIPVTMSGSGGNTNNVSININVASNGSTSTSVTKEDGDRAAREMAAGIQKVVIAEMVRQQGPGGILNKGGRK